MTGVRIDFVIAGEFPGDGKPKPVAFPYPAEHLEPGSEIKVVDLKTLIELKLASGRWHLGSGHLPSRDPKH